MTYLDSMCTATPEGTSLSFLLPCRRRLILARAGLLAVSKKNNVYASRLLGAKVELFADDFAPHSLPLCESIIDYICDSRWEIGAFFRPSRRCS